MGWRPIPPAKPPTNVEQAKRDYITGRLTFNEFLKQIDHLFDQGIQDERAPRTVPKRRLP